jgi:hypothetical protein
MNGTGKVKVSFVTPHWNKLDLLKQSLKSLEKQTYQDFEIVIIENGSTDGSVEFIETHYPSIRLIKLPENVGYAPAANMGIRESRGEYIAFYSNDVYAEPDWLERMVEVLDNEPSIGFCGGKILSNDNPDLIYAAGDTYTLGGYPFNIGQGEKNGEKFDSMREVFCVCTAAALFRKRVFDDVGLLEDMYFAHGDDTDLCLRAQLGGYRGLYVPDAVVYHEGGASSNVMSRDFIFRTNRNALMTFIKDYPFPIMVRHLPQIVQTFVLSLLYTPHKKAALLGRMNVLGYLPYLLKRRWQIQRSRRASLEYIERMMAMHTFMGRL